MSAAKVHHRIELVRGEKRFECRFVADIGTNKFGASGNSFPPSHDEIVQNGNSMSGAQKMVGDDTADVTGSTGNENSHGSPLSECCFCFSWMARRRANAQLL